MSSNFNRIFGFAWKDFTRNKGISVAAIFVLVVSILLISWLFFMRGITQYLTSEIQNKIDITAYFKDTAKEQDILAARDEILKNKNIKSADYVSKEQALQQFNEKHKDNTVLARALLEVGDNPFLPSLNITTNGDPSQYQQIADTLQNSDFSELLDKVDFSQKKDTIEKIYSITSNINKFGIALEIILAFVAFLVVFNTIKLAIESSKEEITTMRIVGASDWFIRGPFVVQGVIYGAMAFLISFLILLVLAFITSPYISAMLPGFSMMSYLLTKFWIFVLIQLCFGIGVGVISSFIVIKKYLKV